jgi:universal stress protein A
MIKKIMATTDFSEEGNKAVPYAASLAVQLGATLALCTVVEKEPHKSHGYIDLTPAPGSEELKKELEDAHARLIALISECGAANLKSVVLAIAGPDPADSVLETLKQLEIDLLIISSHGHTGFRKIFAGGIAEKIIHNACCPVLLLRGGQEGARGPQK